MKNIANNINPKNAERFHHFSRVIFICKIKYYWFNKKLNNTRLKVKNFTQVYAITWQLAPKIHKL